MGERLWKYDMTMGDRRPPSKEELLRQKLDKRQERIKRILNPKTPEQIKLDKRQERIDSILKKKTFWDRSKSFIKNIKNGK